MAFATKALVPLAEAQDGTTLWSYRTDDQARTVLKKSYFGAAAAGRLRAGDRIQVLAEQNTAAPHAFDLAVTAAEGKAVTVAVPGLDSVQKAAAAKAGGG